MQEIKINNFFVRHSKFQLFTFHNFLAPQVFCKIQKQIAFFSKFIKITLAPNLYARSGLDIHLRGVHIHRLGLLPEAVGTALDTVEVEQLSQIQMASEHHTCNSHFDFRTLLSLRTLRSPNHPSRAWLFLPLANSGSVHHTCSNLICCRKLLLHHS